MMSSNLTAWKTVPNFGIKKRPLFGEEVFEHPLKNIIVTERITRRILGSTPSTGRTTPISNSSNLIEPLSEALKKLDPLNEQNSEMDPLSRMANELLVDPLSKIAAEIDEVDKKATFKNDDNIKVKLAKTPVDSWTSKKASILQKYTTSEKLTMVTSFLLEGEKVVVTAQSTAVDKVQHRLEQLDSFEADSQRKLNLSQAEYIFKIQQLNRELVSAWNSEQKVKALKIAIQCAKMLTDTAVLSFYPSKFVLITDILDCFGKLVYERLKTKSAYIDSRTKSCIPLPDNFTPDLVPDTAKETCLNWFYKVASIRELVPRLYVEISLLNSYNFISTNESLEALGRITEMIHGIGNPLVAIYVRCYLCKIGLTNNIKTNDFSFLKRNFECFLETYQHLFSRTIKGEIQRQKMNLSIYMTIYTPALDFIMESIVLHLPNSVLNELFLKCKKYNSSSSLVLNTIMSGYKPNYIAEKTLELLIMIGQCTDDGIPLFSLLRTLGLCVSVAAPPFEHRKPILNAVWTNISQLEKTFDYISCVEVWIGFITQNFTVKEINLVLEDLISRMIYKRNYEKFPNELKNIVKKIGQPTTFDDFEALLVMENFLPLIDLFHEECVKLEVAKFILLNLNRYDVSHKTNDAVFINALMFLGGIIHDSVNSLTPEDEIRQIGDILCQIIRLVDYGQDLFEHQLQFYVEARSSFANLDTVLAHLVQKVNLLAVDIRQIRNNGRKSADFLRACAAYCFITIPSIESAKIRLKLYLLSGRVALYNSCLGQGDACFKAILSVIPELDSGIEAELFLIPFIREFLSTLLIVPDNPERGILSLTKMVLNVLRNFNWTSVNLVYIYLNVIDLLTVMTRDVYPYHVDQVESNDSYYGADYRFIQEIDKMISIIIGEILNILKALGASKIQANIAMELFLRVVLKADLSVNQCSSLALNLWNLVLKSGYADVKNMCEIRDFLCTSVTYQNNHLMQQLLQKLPKISSS